VAINKPAGDVVHASRYAGASRESIAKNLSEQLGTPVFPVHRLDRATSGVLLFSLEANVTSLLSSAFQEQRVRKEYLAVVRGHCPESGRIERALEHMERTIVQDATTEFERMALAELPIPIDRYPCTRLSLVRARPRTGRMHQIRRHLRGINHPILADSVHGDGAINRLAREELGVTRLMLHAWRIELELDGRPLRIEAPIPSDFARIFERLGWMTHPLLAGLNPSC
jgi:tRNA pseudouridine65 synthase